MPGLVSCFGAKFWARSDDTFNVAINFTSVFDVQSHIAHCSGNTTCGADQQIFTNRERTFVLSGFSELTGMTKAPNLGEKAPIGVSPVTTPTPTSSAAIWLAAT